MLSDDLKESIHEINRKECHKECMAKIKSRQYKVWNNKKKSEWVYCDKFNKIIHTVITLEKNQLLFMSNGLKDEGDELWINVETSRGFRGLTCSREE